MYSTGGSARTFVMDGAPVGFGLSAEAGMVSPVQSPRRSRHATGAIEETKDGSDDDYDDDDFGDNEHDGELEYDHDDSHNVVIENIGDEDNVPKMPGGFYSDVETFLSRPPPAVKAAAKKSKTKQKLDDKITKSASLPVLVSRAPPMHHVDSKVNTGQKKGKPRSHKHKSRQQGLDMQLLEEAFQYTEKLQQESIAQELSGANDADCGGVALKKSGSAPTRGTDKGSDQRSRPPHGGGGAVVMSHEDSGENRRSRVNAKERSSGNVAKKLRQQTKTGHGHAHHGNFDTSITQPDMVTRSVVDFDALVENFQQGLTLHKLRSELQESQASMERSRQAMQSISRDAASKMRL